ncbi:hypothetical protein PERCYII40_4314 [Pseudomonas aeruginosa]|nr:hypothetical protein PERCYII40_4314 [Pseudomonas aeruginosa]
MTGFDSPKRRRDAPSGACESSECFCRHRLDRSFPTAGLHGGSRGETLVVCRFRFPVCQPCAILPPSIDSEGGRSCDSQKRSTQHDEG